MPRRNSNKAVSIPQENITVPPVSSVRVGESVVMNDSYGGRVYENRYVEIKFDQNSKSSGKNK